MENLRLSEKKEGKIMTTKEKIKILFSANYGKVDTDKLVKFLISTNYGK